MFACLCSTRKETISACENLPRGRGRTTRRQCDVFADSSELCVGSILYCRPVDVTVEGVVRDYLCGKLERPIFVDPNMAASGGPESVDSSAVKDDESMAWKTCKG